MNEYSSPPSIHISQTAGLIGGFDPLIDRSRQNKIYLLTSTRSQYSRLWGDRTRTDGIFAGRTEGRTVIYVSFFQPSRNFIANTASPKSKVCTAMCMYIAELSRVTTQLSTQVCGSEVGV